MKIAKTCPHEKMSERLKWFKKEHGLGMARAGLVIEQAFGEGRVRAGGSGTSSSTICFVEELRAAARDLRGGRRRIVRKLRRRDLSPRKGYVALYRLKQFGAVKPSKEGLLVGLAMQKYPKSKKLIDVKNLGGGDRNKKALVLASAKDFDGEAKDLIKAAWAEN